jgi:hypothetical protein
VDYDEIVHPPNARQMPDRVFRIFSLRPDLDIPCQGDSTF